MRQIPGEKCGPASTIYTFTLNYSSDADHPPRRLFEMACEAGLAGLCISDHDTVAAIAEGRRLAREFPLEFYPNVEISTHYLTRKFHVLAPLVDCRSAELQSRLEGLAEGRRQQAKTRVERLRNSGFEITLRRGSSEPPETRYPRARPSLKPSWRKPESRESSRLHRYLHGKEAARGSHCLLSRLFCPRETRLRRDGAARNPGSPAVDPAGRRRPGAWPTLGLPAMRPMSMFCRPLSLMGWPGWRSIPPTTSPGRLDGSPTGRIAGTW